MTRQTKKRYSFDAETEAWLEHKAQQMGVSVPQVVAAIVQKERKETERLVESVYAISKGMRDIGIDRT